MSSFSPVFWERAKIIGLQCALAPDPNSPPCDHQILRWTLEMRREWRGGSWCGKCRAGAEGLGSLLVVRTPSHCRGNTPEEVKDPPPSAQHSAAVSAVNKGALLGFHPPNGRNAAAGTGMAQLWRGLRGVVSCQLLDQACSPFS